MECLDAPRLFEVFATSCPPAAREALEDHLDGCEDCRALAAAYALVADDGLAEPFSSTSIEPPEHAATRLLDGLPVEPRPVPRRAGDVVGGRYRLDEVVGEGGMGVVWAATELSSGRRFALKLLKIEAPDLSRRVEREARVSTVIRHPHVVEVLELLTPPECGPVLVMALLRGESLDRTLARRAPLSAGETVELLLPLVGALRAAHARGVLHRDLKPSNVFLAREDDALVPVVLLLDFGLAKLLGEDLDLLTRTGAILGTPHYMSPEQLFGERDIDRRADVWALGAVAFECLSARRPLEGNSYAQLVRNASTRTIPRVAEVAPDAPPALGALIDRMLSHDRERRPELAEIHAILDEASRASARREASSSPPS